MKNDKDHDILDKEAKFHDNWALSENVDEIDVRQINEACTSPELRYIHSHLGNLHNKTVLDLGCGLGEASVYFALAGADVTASDLSPEMVSATTKLAERYGVKVKPHVASAENLGINVDKKFDIIYAGNVLHHADIDEVVKNVNIHLKPDGTFVSWDPLAYNPIINVYRLIATSVRTPDEKPLNLRDINKVRSHFKSSEIKYFWITTLIVFILMIFVKLKNPNKVRLWKEVVRQENSWKWLYNPLEKLDAFLLKIVPGIGLLAWNVVIIAKK